MSTSKKIVFMNSIGADVWRGGEKWMVNAAAGLAGRGHTITCIGKKKALWLSKAHARGLSIKEMPIHGDFDLRIIIPLIVYFKHHKPDVLCCNFEKDVRLGGIAAKIAGVPLIYVRKGLCLMYEKWRYRMAYRYIVDRIISPAQYIKDQFKQFKWLDQNRIDVVHNGVEFPDTARMNRGALLMLCTSAQQPLIFAAGSLFYQKGFEYLIEALSIVHSKKIPAHVIIAGAGDQAPYKKLAAEFGVGGFVHFPGHHNNLQELMYSADCFVLSSVDEGLPNVVLEAMAVGTAVIAADAGGTHEIICDGETGYVVPIKNAQALAEKILKVLGDPDLRAHIGNAGLQRVKQSFTNNAMVDSVETLFCKPV